MRLLGLDTETTGLDRKKDYITELGFALIEVGKEKPLIAETHLLQIPDNVKVPEEIVELTHITKEMLSEFGQNPKKIYARLASIIEDFKVDYVVAHNAPFDREMLESNFDKHAVPMFKANWLDTRTDVPYPERFRHKNLTYLCGEHGFANPFPHAALFDVMAMMKLLSLYDFEKVIEYKNIPSVIVRAMVEFERKDEAKSRGFMWQEVDGKTFVKSWVKKVKEDKLEALKAESPFDIVIVG